MLESWLQTPPAGLRVGENGQKPQGAIGVKFNDLPQLMGEALVYEFGPFRLRADDRLLTRDGLPVRVTPKAIDLLLALLEAGERVARKEDLLRSVWSDAVVTESSLTYHISVLRTILGDEVTDPTYIETIPRRGYRFVAPVTCHPVTVGENRGTDSLSISTGLLEARESGTGSSSDSAAGPESDASVFEVPNRATRGSWWQRPLFTARNASLALVAACLAIVAAAVVGGREPRTPQVTAVKALTGGERPAGGPLLGSDEFLAFPASNGQGRLRLAGDSAEQSSLEGFWLLDVSPLRREALATRPSDVGAETALWAVPLDGRQARRIGRLITTGSAAWSPDGQRIAYVHERDLYVADTLGGNVRRLGSYGASPERVGWAPDGRSLRVSLSFAASRSNTGSLWDVPIDGSDASRTLPQMSVFHCCGSWLPEGRGYVFEVMDGNHGQLWLLQESRRRFGRPVQRLTQLTSGTVSLHSPFPSADGSRVYAIGQSAIRTTRYDVHHRAFAPFMNDMSAFNVEYSRTGDSLLYITFPELELWTARADGSQSLRLTTSPFEVSGASWSPDGKWIAVRVKLPNRRAKIFIIPSAGGTPRPLVLADVEQGTPSWSPDGKFIVFGDVPEIFGVPTGSETLHTYDVESGSLATVPASQQLWTGRWSPDGKYLAALTIVGQKLMLYDIRKRRWRGTGVDHVGGITWSPDGAYIYCDPEGPQSWARRFRLADGATESLVDLAGLQRLHSGGIAMDGSPLFLLSSMDVYSINLAFR